MSNKFKFPKKNNLEWLRLLFALQVMTVHASEHMDFSIPQVFQNFPGVPAFFFVSGFLIYASYLNAPGFRYFQNRFLRLFPGLLFVTFGSLVVVVVAKGMHFLFEHSSIFAVWFLAQISLGQTYNPTIFREIGVGVLNGSLWTITTEILFYLIVPILALLEKRFRHAVLVLSILSFVIYAAGPSYLNQKIIGTKSVHEILSITPITWGWTFGLGILTFRYFAKLSEFMPYFLWLLLPTVVMISMGEGVLWGSTGNRLGLAYFVCYMAIVLWIAFELPPVALSFDLSYGTYVWHMPIINLMLVLNFKNFAMVACLTLFLATISWFLIEKPMLSLKRNSLRSLRGAKL